jgi:hypothetical protein
VHENIGDEEREMFLAQSEIEPSLKIDGATQFNNDIRDDMIVGPLRHCANEKLKALASFVFMCFGFFVATVSLAATHDRLPDREVYKPLPDILLDNIANREYLLKVSEMQIITANLLCIFLFVFHKQR